MTSYNFAFYISEKRRTHLWHQNLSIGARVHGDFVHALPQGAFTGVDKAFDGAINMGMARACKMIMSAYLDAGKHFIYLDKGYTGRGIYWRFSVDAWQPLTYFQRYKRPDDRFRRTELELRPRRETFTSDEIVLAGACQAYNNLFGLGDVTEYNADIVAQLRAKSERQIVYRPNPAWVAKHGDEFREIPDTLLSSGEIPFTDALGMCHLLVTHGTSAAFTALAMGVPVMVLGPGICKPLASTQWAQVEEPLWPDDKDRYQFFNDVAYCQWTTSEYRSGEAWAEMRLVLETLAKTKTAMTLDQVVAQYKLMHESPKYFRGLTMLKHFRNIGRLILKTDSATVLDYGCGKGQQYESPYEMHKAWDVAVTCYDPGVPVFAQMPKGTYDGVVCCDVMEHLPEKVVQEVLQRILSFANKFVFLSISTQPATKVLPNGHNCHLTVMPERWWEDQIAQARVAVNKPNLLVELVTSLDTE